MKITGGRIRGRSVPVALASGVRPTSSRVREALFSMLGSNLTGMTFLDAFGGAGLMGLEAWSRGATVTVVERNSRAYRDIVTRGRELEVDWTTRRGDVFRLVNESNRFDIVFVDPPYADDFEPVFQKLSALARSYSVSYTHLTLPTICSV